MTVYIDTSAWIALYDRKERDHAAARKELHSILGRRERIATGWHTLVELADGLTHHFDQRLAAEEIDRLLRSAHLRVLPSEPHREAAMSTFGARTAWGVDLSDCLSFALMEAEGIRRAFTFDSDFEKAGFERVPRT